MKMNEMEQQLFRTLAQYETKIAELGFVLHAQYEVQSDDQQYRLDFALVAADGRRLAVEADGHDWHEKQRWQVEQDRIRERNLMLLGWRVLRFTGTEVVNHTRRCVDEILLHARQMSILCMDDELAKRATTALIKWVDNKNKREETRKLRNEKGVAKVEEWRAQREQFLGKKA